MPSTIIIKEESIPVLLEASSSCRTGLIHRIKLYEARLPAVLRPFPWNHSTAISHQELKQHPMQLSELSLSIVYNCGPRQHSSYKLPSPGVN